jgi:hypothetical protein
VRVALGTAAVVTLTHLGSSSLDAQESKGVRVCLGTDNLLRFTSGERCPQGQRMFRLAEVEDEVGVTKERDDSPNAIVADLKTKVDFLTRRVANVESEMRKLDTDSKSASNDTKSVPKPDPRLPTQVRAPFEVVDSRGNPIFVVSDAVHALVPRRGRFEIARASTGDNHFSMMMRNAGGTAVAGLGELDGGGAMYLADAAGKTRMFAAFDSGLKISNGSETGVIQLKVGSGGAGQFWLYDAGGTAMVKAGTEGTVGTVVVGPNFKCTGSAGLRVPDCIVGRP